jgi:hypothetical protein
MVDLIQITHMAISGLTSLAALYFKTEHGKLSTRVAVLEERSKNDKDLLDKLDSKLDDVRNSLNE